MEDKYSEDYYALLNIKKDATIDVIKKAYRKLLLKSHPDKSRKEDITLFHRARKALEVLTHYKKDYDTWLTHTTERLNKDPNRKLIAEDLLRREKQPHIVPLKRVYKEKTVEEASAKKLSLEVRWQAGGIHTSVSLRKVFGEYGVIEDMDVFDSKAIIVYKLRDSAIKASKGQCAIFTVRLMNSSIPCTLNVKSNENKKQCLSDMEKEIFEKIMAKCK